MAKIKLEIDNKTTYDFYFLEKYLQEWENRNKCLLVENCEYGSSGIMHIFHGNFCGDWLDGDGIIFYSDGEQHSAEDNDHFYVISIIEF